VEREGALGVGLVLVLEQSWSKVGELEEDL
jgi:hypothetical protein